MDGSRMSLLETFPLVLAGVSKDNLGSEGRERRLRYGCRDWVRDVQGLFGTASTTRNWQNLFRRGRRLSSRMVALSKLSSSHLPKPLATK